MSGPEVAEATIPLAADAVMTLMVIDGELTAALDTYGNRNPAGEDYLPGLLVASCFSGDVRMSRDAPYVMQVGDCLIQLPCKEAADAVRAFLSGKTGGMSA